MTSRQLNDRPAATPFGGGESLCEDRFNSVSAWSYAGRGFFLSLYEYTCGWVGVCVLTGSAWSRHRCVTVRTLREYPSSLLLGRAWRPTGRRQEVNRQRKRGKKELYEVSRKTTVSHCRLLVERVQDERKTTRSQQEGLQEFNKKNYRKPTRKDSRKFIWKTAACGGGPGDSRLLTLK